MIWALRFAIKMEEGTNATMEEVWAAQLFIDYCICCYFLVSAIFRLRRPSVATVRHRARPAERALRLGLISA
jgi:hypothetical protein